LKVDNASYWFLLYGYITMHGQRNIKLVKQVEEAVKKQRSSF